MLLYDVYYVLCFECLASYSKFDLHAQVRGVIDTLSPFEMMLAHWHSSGSELLIQFDSALRNLLFCSWIRLHHEHVCPNDSIDPDSEETFSLWTSLHRLWCATSICHWNSVKVLPTSDEGMTLSGTMRILLASVSSSWQYRDQSTNTMQRVA